ncbi:MAG: FecR domain-containing protein [Acidobacteria bacterium]|nr:FecR domain-containing protein [Acidobacteriota bacterium]
MIPARFLGSAGVLVLLPLVHSPTQFPEIKEGEYLRTEQGRAEVLLTPGVFLRLGEETRVQMLASRLSDVRLRLLAGAAVVEADEIGKENAVTVQAGEAEVHLLRSGLYRFDIQGLEPARLRVFAGEALVSGEKGEIRLGNKKEIELAGDFQSRKFNLEDTDPLDRWSKRRGGYLAAANVSASRQAYHSGLAYYGSGWIFNPYYGMFTFLPYRDVIWSPYGYGFYSPWAVYYLYTPPRGGYLGGGGGRGGGIVAPPSTGRNRAGAPPASGRPSGVGTAAGPSRGPGVSLGRSVGASRGASLGGGRAGR